MARYLGRWLWVGVGSLTATVGACGAGHEPSSAGAGVESSASGVVPALGRARARYRVGVLGGDAPWLAAGAPRLVERTDGVLEATAPVGTRRSLAARVRLPARASGELHVEDATSRLSIGVTLLGAREDSAAVVSDGVAVYEQGGPEGAHLFQRVGWGGAEDWLEYQAAPREERVSYRLAVPPGVGLRQVGDGLEVLDARGAPRLRMRVPFLVDELGTLHAVRTEVGGCAVDRSPAAPWGRPLTEPGASTCTVTLRWGAAAGLPVPHYPALLDPSWTVTGSMSTLRTGHAAARLADGRVLVVGGEYASGASVALVAGADLFDPATDTFAATGSLAQGRSFLTVTLLQGGDVLAVGGRGVTGELGTSEIWNPTTGTWSAGALLTGPRQKHQALRLGDGSVLVAGGLSGFAVLDTAETFDATGATSAPASPMGFRRYGHTLHLLQTGQALAVAGITTTSTADLRECEVYSPLTRTWSVTGGLSDARYFHAADTLPDGRILVAGGYSRGISGNLNSTERFDPGTGTWSTQGQAQVRAQYHTLTALPDGAALMVGGVRTSEFTTVTAWYTETALFDPSRSSWVSAGALNSARRLHTATALLDGRVLIAGGDGPLGAHGDAEVFALDANGAACTSAVTCASGICADGVCCDSDCTGSCMACSAASTGGVDGTCAPALAGTDPGNDCQDEGSPGCGQNGFCNGAGACANYPAVPCTPNPCTSGSECASGRCYDGVCCDIACTGTCRACAAALKGYGVDGVCEAVADGLDTASECPSGGTGVCQGDGVCNGAGSCRLTSTGTECGAATCLDATTWSEAGLCAADGSCGTTSYSCYPFACDATTGCRSSCTAASHCAPGLSCIGGYCQAKSNGEGCTSGSECSSGYCVDDVCCDSSCGEQCLACDVAGSEGSCQVVTGAPRGNRSPCSGSGACEGTCDGSSSYCSYPGPSTVCGSATCSGDQQSGQLCDGSGSCQTQTISCYPYACGAGACETSCTTSADCTTGFACTATGECQDASQPFCFDEGTVGYADGTRVSCDGFLCSGGYCLSSCSSDSQCIEGAVCVETEARCYSGSGSDSGGCGCRAVGDTGRPSGFGLAVLAAVAGLSRRRPRGRPGAQAARRGA